MSWLDPLRAALDDAPALQQIFFRDDDAGWADQRLLELLGRFDAHGLPVDVAVIPAEVTPVLTRELQARMDTAPVRLHQHGWAHVNHEPVGRKCEVGPARDRCALVADLQAGQRLLREAFGDQVDPVFTPPWNRCALETGKTLAALGFEVLSRDLSAGLLDVPGLAEIPVTVDWFGHRKGVRWTRDELGEALGASVRRDAVVGVMLHHAITDAQDLTGINELLQLVSEHDAAAATTIRAAADARTHQPTP